MGKNNFVKGIKDHLRYESQTILCPIIWGKESPSNFIFTPSECLFYSLYRSIGGA